MDAVHMRVCTVMAAYNGLPYIKDQMDSIRKQTVQPDRVIISDDGSTDGTAEFVAQYIEEHGLDRWSLMHHKSDGGWMRNFIDAMAEVQEELIILTDQDDIWMPDKVERYIMAFQENPEAEVVVSNYDIFYNAKDRTQQRFDRQTSTMKNSGNVLRWPITPQLHVIDRPGCVYGVRTTFYRELRRFYPDGQAHDNFLWLCAMALGRLYLIDAPLIKYRRHSGNAIKKKTLGSVPLKDRTAFIENELHVIRGVRSTMFEKETTTKEECILDEFEAFCDARLRFLTGKNAIKWFALAAKYRQFYPSSKSLLADLLIWVRG